MTLLILDTSFLVALHNEDDVHHARARQILDGILAGQWAGVLLHEYVFLETVTVLAARRSFVKAVEVGEALLAAEKIETVTASEDFAAVWQAFRSQPRGKLSFADSALVALARMRGATHLATFDRDLLKASGLADAAALAA